MVGQARQQRPARHLLDVLDAFVEPAFFADCGADVGRRGIVAAGGEIEKDAVGGEVADLARLQILDRRIVATAQQRDPIIVGADMHPALVGADFDVRLLRRRAFRRRRGVEFARMLAITVHYAGPHFLQFSGENAGEA